MLPVLLGLLALGACRTNTPPTPDEGSCKPFAQVAPEGTSAMLPLVAPIVPPGGAAIVGYVADSGSNRGVGGALIRLIRTETNTRDSVLALSDSTGGFQIGGLKPGRYLILVRSVSFHFVRDSLELSIGVDTLRIAMRRDLPLCRVRLK